MKSLPSGATSDGEKVREIYRLGLKHGMGLAAIASVNGVFSEEDIARVAEQARFEPGKAAARNHGSGNVINGLLPRNQPSTETNGANS
ncbi:MAG: hypothetical protein R3F37_07810 [Candidatus Competibacteraceae bacterium]